MDRPETRYVAVGDADVAYQIVGDGPIDLLYFYGLGSHVEIQWEYPKMAHVMEEMASLGRLIRFDRRGTGASDGVFRNAIPTWEDWTDDIGMVLDAAGSERAAIMAVGDAGPFALLYTAMHPDRVRSLVLCDTGARALAADDYPIGIPQAELDAIIQMIEALWGRAEFVDAVGPNSARDPELRSWLARMQRCASTPRSAAAQYRYIFESDARPALPLIRVPTLVIHHADNVIASIDHARYLVEHIERARLFVLEGSDGVLGPADFDSWFPEVAEFVTGVRPELPVERVLTTVLFTDIVASTERAATLGDAQWHAVLDSHDRVVREQLHRFGGREVNTTGDGFVASFDGPARAIRFAHAAQQATRILDIDLRVGLHTGECEVRGSDLGGLAVHIAARVGSLATPGEVWVSGTVKDLMVGSDIKFNERGEHELKGVPGSWKLFAVAG
jgi:class 3 adenylate cyclase